MGTNHCKNQQLEAFERRRSKKCVKTRRDFTEIFPATFLNKTWSEYYGSNWSVYIENISVDYVLEKQNRSIIIFLQSEIVTYFIHLCMMIVHSMVQPPKSTQRNQCNIYVTKLTLKILEIIFEKTHMFAQNNKYVPLLLTCCNY